MESDQRQNIKNHAMTISHIRELQHQQVTPRITEKYEKRLSNLKLQSKEEYNKLRVLRLNSHTIAELDLRTVSLPADNGRESTSQTSLTIASKRL